MHRIPAHWPQRTSCSDHIRQDEYATAVAYWISIYGSPVINDTMLNAANTVICKMLVEDGKLFDDEEFDINPCWDPPTLGIVIYAHTQDIQIVINDKGIVS